MGGLPAVHHWPTRVMRARRDPGPARGRAVNNEHMIRRRLVARGTVQGVFFRDSCRREAKRRHVSGWVTNRSDGSVEAVFEGEADQVEAMVAWAHHGPLRAKVTAVEVTSEDPVGESGFRVVTGRG